MTMKAMLRDALVTALAITLANVAIQVGWWLGTSHEVPAWFVIPASVICGWTVLGLYHRRKGNDTAPNNRMQP